MKDAIQILIVDDQINTCKSLQAILKKSGYRSEYTLSAEEALGRVQERGLSTSSSATSGCPAWMGCSFWTSLKKIQPHLVVIMVTGYATIKSAVEAIQKGAYDYLPKPFTPDEVRVIIERAAEKIRLESENDALRRGLQPQVTFQNIIGNSPALQRVFEMIQKVADTDSNILITGETGTGKELVAKAIHNLSRRREKAFPADQLRVPGRRNPGKRALRARQGRLYRRRRHPQRAHRGGGRGNDFSR